MLVMYVWIGTCYGARVRLSIRDTESIFQLQWFFITIEKA